MLRQLLLGSALLAACTGGGEPDVSTASAFLFSYHTTLCEVAHGCRAEYPDGGVFDFDTVFGKSVDECFAGPYADPDALEASVAAGRVGYSKPDAEACLAAVARQPCELLFQDEGIGSSLFADRLPRFGGCPTTFTPHVDEGSACATDFDCKPRGEDVVYCSEGVCRMNT
jgi:hypothetical protein